MKSMKSIFTVLLVGAAVLFSTTSCKKCNLSEEDNVYTGIINKNGEDDVIVYAKVGYMDIGNGHITGASPVAENFEVSFDGGKTKQAVDFGTYDIVANPVTVKCESAFDRKVVVDHPNNIVTYSVTARTCAECDAERIVYNYVLIESIPSGYTYVKESKVVPE